MTPIAAAHGGERLHSLDVLRGLAALAVVLWHWQHLQLLGGSKLTWPPLSQVGLHEREPFFPMLRLFYEYGFYAVDLFFLLSGFVFFWLYRKPLERNAVTAGGFLLARISRLYPLHIATLLLIIPLQSAFAGLTGQFFVYAANDGPHFLLSLFFIQLAGGSAAFNGPEWSLFVEVLMYALFFLLARVGALRWAIGSLVVFVWGLYLYDGFEPFARGLCGFFLGGMTFSFYESLRRRSWAKFAFGAVAGLAALGWTLVLLVVYGIINVDPLFAALRWIAHGRLPTHLVLYGLFPATILAVVGAESVWRLGFGRLAWLGEASYSSYLLHFPLQLVLAVMVYLGLVSAAGARSSIGLLLYLAVLIPLSIIVFRRFERPAQQLIRDRWHAIAVRRREAVVASSR